MSDESMSEQCCAHWRSRHNPRWGCLWCSCGHPKDCRCAGCELDGDTECQCARCGSSVARVRCDACGGSGRTEPGELQQEDPLRYDEDDTEPCHDCSGAGGWWKCESSIEWCEANPLPGREDVASGGECVEARRPATATERSHSGWRQGQC